MKALDIQFAKIRSLWGERTTFAGLFIYLILLNGAIFPAARWLYTSIIDIQPIKGTILCAWSLLIIVIGIIIFNILLLIVWLYWRTLPKFEQHENTVIFAPHYDPECADLVRSIFDQFTYEIARRKSGWDIKAVHLPRNYQVANSEEAHALLYKTGARLIVFGQVDQGESGGEHIVGFRNISFSLRHRELRDFEKPAVNEDLAGALAYRAFTAKSSNSYIEKDVVVNNIAEVTLFFIALGLTLESILDEAINILESLHENTLILAQKNTSPLHYKHFLRSINRCLSVALDSKFIRLYSSSLIEHITDREHDEDFRVCLRILDRLLEINPKKSCYPLRKAIFDLHFDNVDQAFREISKAKEFAPVNNPAPHFSMAFLCLWKKQFKRALREYQKVLACDYHELSVYGPVLDFLQSFYRRFPDRPEFLFALGFMNQNFFDIERAETDYREFLDLAELDVIFSPLVIHAREQIAKLANSSGSMSTRADG